MNIKLSNEESRYLLARLADARAYYGQLALNSNCTPKNRHMHELVEAIARKLSERRPAESRAGI